MRRNAILAVLVVLGVAVGSLPAAAASGLTVGLAGTDDGAVALQANETQNNSSVNVSVGQQLSTVLAVTEAETESEVEETAFSISVETENESEKAEAIAERAESLRERAQDIREDYREATAAYEAGELTKSEYAQRLAVLNARAQTILEAYERLQQVASNVSALELRAAGYQQANTSATLSNLSTVTGAGASALLKRFTGESEGEVEIETKGGLSISVESEDGEQSREFERPRDDDRNFTVNQTAALSTARSALSDTNGTWVLTKSSVHESHGTYRFEFRLDANATEGEATVAVDGSSGKIVTLEEEIEDVDDEGDDEERADERENESDSTDSELSLLVASGTPAPNETVTLKALVNGEPASNVTVRLNDEVVGTTGANGTVQVTLPASGDAELTAVRGEAEAELEFEFGENEREEIRRSLNATGSVDNGTVTVSVTYNGSGVAGATVYANGEKVGTTGADGTLSFQTNATEELELEIVKGEFEATLTFTITDGSLTLTETDVSGDEREDESETESDSETESEDESETESDSDSETESEDESETEDEKTTETEDEEETDTDEQDTEDDETDTDSTETDSDD